MKIIEVTDYDFRKVVRVVMNPDDPEAIHADGRPHTGTPTRDVVSAFRAEFGREPKPWEWCKDWMYNWRGEEFTFTRGELEVGLNKWGNPAYDDHEIVSTRAKTWDELPAEVEGRLGILVGRGNAPLEAPPAQISEVAPDFEQIVVGEPYMEDGLAKLRYGVLRLGVPKMFFIATGEDKAGSDPDRDMKYAQAQQEILDTELELAQAQAIVSA